MFAIRRPATSERPVRASRYFFGGRACGHSRQNRSSMGAQREVRCSHHASLHHILHSFPIIHRSVESVFSVVLDLKCTGWAGRPECCCTRGGPPGMVRSDLLHQKCIRSQDARSAPPLIETLYTSVPYTRWLTYNARWSLPAGSTISFGFLAFLLLQSRIRSDQLV